jgi:predicted flavoprotein YhiN
MPQDVGTMQYDVVVLGAGAAGMMCAFEAGTANAWDRRF